MRFSQAPAEEIFLKNDSSHDPLFSLFKKQFNKYFSGFLSRKNVQENMEGKKIYEKTKFVL